MVAAMWDPGQYLRFGDLLARINADAPGMVVDLGCGPGNLTSILAERWPQAQVLGVDNSPEMIATAKASASATASATSSATAGAAGPGRLSFTLADIRDWLPDRPVDVFVSNAVLQWVPD